MDITKVFLLLGSNLGERLAILESARKAIAERIGDITDLSSVYETAPWGVLDQPPFMNQVVALDTTLQPEDVLRNILEIENELGRIRYERWGARVIDIDILYFGNLEIESSRLTVPHPRLQDRRFTLIPLCEIAGEYIHPILLKTNNYLLEICSDHSEVTKL